ncbi:MAG: glycyl-radical enzyme activating protein, partial [Thermodesulfobacteriota bacterium]|nr:glycyl-radical enzyme activating protein [Thermodesulfobacteriota bacterium]
MESSENIQEPQIIDTLDIPVSQDGKDEERTGLITNIQMFCTNDGPGIRTTVFLKGCRLNCRWCHNPEGKRRYPEIFPYTVNCTGCKACVEACPMDALSLTEPNIIKIDKGLCTVCLQCVEICKENAIHVWGRMVKVKDVIDEVAKDKPFYDNSGGGMTVSGGEPTAQPEFTLSLFRCAKEREINCALDTCGHTPWEVLEPIIELTDYVLYDIKHMDPKEHKDYCGFSNTLILNNARKIAER